jgi:DNA polymerase III sliding clamp (beta) subunit (PCNA family)
VELLVRNQETGDEGREYLACETYEGESVTIVFNVDNLVDFLAASDSQHVVVAMRDGHYQALFQPERGEEEGVHKYVVMPLRFD